MARIVFDLDGTLVDSAPDIRAAANETLRDSGAAFLTLAETVAFIGHGAAHFVERMRKARDLPKDAGPNLLRAFQTHYADRTALSRLYPHVSTALGRLADRGHTLGLCTNKPAAPTAAVLSHFDLAGYFRAVVAGDSLPQRKPDPAPLHAALKSMGSGPTLYVGDSEVDAETARRAGVPFVLFTQGYRHVPVEAMPHAATFADWADLPDLCERVLR